MTYQYTTPKKTSFMKKTPKRIEGNLDFIHFMWPSFIEHIHNLIYKLFLLINKLS